MKTEAGHTQADQAGKKMTKSESYAASLVALAKSEADLALVDQDLAFVRETLAGHSELKKSLLEKDLPTEKKQRVIEEVFGAKVSMVTLNFVQLLAGMSQIDMLDDVSEDFARRLQVEENKVIAEVTTAVALGDKFSGRLAKRLSELTGREVILRQKVDADIVGGIIVRVDGQLLDASVKNQLSRLREEMIIDMRGR
ncbi:MAG TPA: ATP synthase F1 subunit delta [Actinobacteria bacterium]|nr:ATP synthase F1 subunit delta [Actinomycetota bacterium]